MSALRLITRAFSSQTPTTKRPARALDLCFFVGDDSLRRMWDACPLQPEDSGLEPMCGVLLRCSELPPVLSITHSTGEREQQVLPRMLAYVQHACDVLSANVDQAEMADDFTPGGRALA